MIGQYLSNTNKNATVTILQNFLELNKAKLFCNSFFLHSFIFCWKLEPFGIPILHSFSLETVVVEHIRATPSVFYNKIVLVRCNIKNNTTII